MVAQDHKIKMTLRRLPNVNSFEHADQARYTFFTKKIWKSLYEENTGYTILFIPHYFDFVKLRTHMKGENA